MELKLRYHPGLDMTFSVLPEGYKAYESWLDSDVQTVANSDIYIRDVKSVMDGSRRGVLNCDGNAWNLILSEDGARLESLYEQYGIEPGPWMSLEDVASILKQWRAHLLQVGAIG